MSSALAAYRKVRDETQALAAPLSAEDCCVQSMTEASPAKWHLGHTTWFFETFILERAEPGFRPFDASFRVLFNSYYHGVGARHPRPQRGMLTRPTLATVMAWREDVDRRMARLLAAAPPPALLDLGLHHERQHQELLLTDVKHLFSLNPLAPAYAEAAAAPAPSGTQPLTWCGRDAGLYDIGAADGVGFCFDNERPRHAVHVEAHALASRLVTNGEYLDFVADGGYATPQLWLSDGWDWLQAGGRRHPAYWRRDEDGWQEFTLGGMRRLDTALPVVHVSYYEADAFARWSAARLPTEAEWEVAAARLPVAGNFADSRRFHPDAAGAGMAQVYGDAWEWTSSAYAPYPGFRIAPGAVGEYNGKFMVNQYVLRGGSCATPAGQVHDSYRNFFPAASTWQFSGIRLARDSARHATELSPGPV